MTNATADHGRGRGAEAGLPQLRLVPRGGEPRLVEDERADLAPELLEQRGDRLLGLVCALLRALFLGDRLAGLGHALGPLGWLGGECTAVRRARQAAETVVAAPLGAMRTIVPVALVSTT